MKKLPSIDKFIVNSKINNNRVVFDSLKDNVSINKESNKDNKSILEKINNLINNKKYIFNIEVNLIFSDHEELCKIAGVVNNHIITMDNKIISINDLIDIKVIEK